MTIADLLLQRLHHRARPCDDRGPRSGHLATVYRFDRLERHLTDLRRHYHVDPRPLPELLDSLRRELDQLDRDIRPCERRA
jgi:hypothetical protein